MHKYNNVARKRLLCDFKRLGFGRAVWRPATDHTRSSIGPGRLSMRPTRCVRRSGECCRRVIADIRSGEHILDGRLPRLHIGHLLARRRGIGADSSQVFKHKIAWFIGH
jgi:hypothetical protein